MKTLVLNVLFFLILLSGRSLQAQAFTNFTTSNGLPSNNVLGVAVDTDNNKWFATQAGVAKYDGSSWAVFTTADGIIDNYITCIAVDISNNVWVGTDYGVSKYDGTHWTSYNTTNGLVNNMVNYISGDYDGSVWFGTGSGLSNLRGTVWTNYTTAQGLANDMVSFIAVDKAGYKWFGTWLGGLSEFDGTTFKTYTTADSLKDNNVYSIAIDANRNKWIGFYNGITKLDSLDNWVKNYDSADGLLYNAVKDLDTDTKGNLWVGMYDDYTQDGGISRFNGSSWLNFKVADGLVNANVNRIAVDKSNLVWIATGNGVSRFNDVNAGIKQDSKSLFSLYPNPVHNSLNFTLEAAPAMMTITDITGNVLFKQSTAVKSGSINVSQLNAGIYFLQVIGSDKGLVRKFIVK
jgi:ligand-binding sensor domain-containing protein